MRPKTEFPKPSLTADAAVFRIERGRLEVLLVRRANEPFKGAWAFPGGFVEKDEPIARAASRELFEETGLKGVQLSQFHSFGDPGRDPRGWTVTVAHIGAVRPGRDKTKAGDDAQSAKWFDAANPPRLAFDHADILNAALNRLKGAVLVGGFGLRFLPADYTAADLAGVFSAVLGRRVDPSAMGSVAGGGPPSRPGNRKRRRSGLRKTGRKRAAPEPG